MEDYIVNTSTDVHIVNTVVFFKYKITCIPRLACKCRQLIHPQGLLLPEKERPLLLPVAFAFFGYFANFWAFLPPETCPATGGQTGQVLVALLDFEVPVTDPEQL